MHTLDNREERSKRLWPCQIDLDELMVERPFTRQASSGYARARFLKARRMLVWTLLLATASGATACREELGPEMQTLLSDPMASYDAADVELVERSVEPPREIAGKPSGGLVRSIFIVDPGVDQVAVLQAAVDAADRQGWEFFTDDDEDIPSAFKTIDGIDASLSMRLLEDRGNEILRMLMVLR